MDDVGPEVIGSVATIRERFNRRRKGTSSLDRLVRRLLGLDAKMAQYRDGARFVRSVLDDVGMEGLNKVWVESAHLPSMAEIAAPRSWVRRVHG
jgi:putative hydrolase